MSISHTQNLIEQLIIQSGSSPEEHLVSKDPIRYELFFSNYPIWIDLVRLGPNEDEGYLDIMAPLFKMPDKNKEAFAIDCLQINTKLISCAIGLRDQYVVFTNTRETLNLDQTELDAIVARIAEYQRDYAGKLLFKYEGSWLTATQEKPGRPPGPVM